MKKFLAKFPEQITRLTIVFILFIGGIVLLKFLLPPILTETALQRKAATAREMNKEIKHAGSLVCMDCHEEVFAFKKDGYHRDLACETCHGPAQGHTENPTEIKPPAPRDRKFCPQCHAYNPSRPKGFPQINPVIHNPLEPCISCHNPHNPTPPETPHECAACHGEIARTKAVSAHALLDCTVCHVTPKQHKIKPWTIRPSKPMTRDFCGQCHGQDSQNKKAPKIDSATHGQKYLCWQCHYPHMPEVE